MKFYFLFGAVFAIAILTPHIVRGHVFIATKYAESVILFLDLTVAYIFYFFYKKEIERTDREKKQTEETLLDSYKYIGKVNGQIELFNKFINSLSFKGNGGKLREKDIFNDLLQTIINSVLKTEKGLIRFINKNNSKTIKEFFYHKGGDQFVVKLSNSELIKGEAGLRELVNKNGGINIVSSDYSQARIICVLCYPKKQDKSIDNDMLKALLNQIHLLFLVIHSKIFINQIIHK